jgi:hypothetical protein
MDCPIVLNKMEYDQAEKFILHFLEKYNSPSFSERNNCLFVEGEWGIGKTHLVRHVLSSYKARHSDVQLAYYSVCGKSSLEQIDEDLYCLLFPHKAKTFRLLRNLTITPSISSFAGVSVSFDLASLNHRFSNSKRKRDFVIVIDDIERHSSTIELNSLLGLLSQTVYAANSVPLTNSKIIFICNDITGFSSDDRARYCAYRDKMANYSVCIDELNENSIQKIFQPAFYLFFLCCPFRKQLPKNFRALFIACEKWVPIYTGLFSFDYFSVQYTFNVFITIFCYYYNYFPASLRSAKTNEKTSSESNVIDAERSPEQIKIVEILNFLYDSKWFGGLPENEEETAEYTTAVVDYFEKRVSPASIPIFGSRSMLFYSKANFLSAGLVPLSKNEQGRKFLIFCSNMLVETAKASKNFVTGDEIDLFASEIALFEPSCALSFENMIWPKLKAAIKQNPEFLPKESEFQREIKESQEATQFLVSTNQLTKEAYFLSQFPKNTNFDSLELSENDVLFFDWLLEQKYIERKLSEPSPTLDPKDLVAYANSLMCVFEKADQKQFDTFKSSVSSAIDGGSFNAKYREAAKEIKKNLDDSRIITRHSW